MRNEGGSFPDTTFVDLDGFDSLESVNAFEESIDECVDAMGSMPFASRAAGEGMGGKTWDGRQIRVAPSLCVVLHRSSISVNVSLAPRGAAKLVRHYNSVRFVNRDTALLPLFPRRAMALVCP